ncbi:hypothetical protein V6Z72_14425 [Cereibacter sphaeroides]|uniref:hypothetical protein n=1 Tax=Cereibacter sphaeroides TaxID=1063 RepID=UPI003990AE1F
MTLDIRGSLKNTRISNNPLVVVDELLANSIDAFLIRRFSSEESISLKIDLSVKAIAADLLGETYDLEISCKDNGCGLGSEQRKAFLTKDTSYKDDLSIAGIGKCKGAGRVQFFHHFSEIQISSFYTDEGKKIHVYLPGEKDRKLIDESDFVLEERSRGPVGTLIKLSHTLPKVRESIFTARTVHRLLPAEEIKQYVLFNLLQRFVGLKEELGSFSINIASDLNGQKSTATLQPIDIPEHTFTQKITIIHADGEDTISSDLQVTHYKLEESKYSLPRNIVALCAKAAIAKNITSRYLKSKALENNSIDGHFHIVLVEGNLLDEGVNEQRDGFDKIPESNDNGDLFGTTQITFDDIYAVLDDTVQKLIAPPDWSRDKIVAEVAHDFGVSEEMLSHSNTRVKFGDTPSDVAKRVLTNLQEKVVDETSSLLTLKEAVERLEPGSEDFRRRIDDLSWEYASSLKTIDMANLSQLIVRRSALIDVLDLAVNQGLKVQTDTTGSQRRRNEALIHSIFFPMRKDSKEVVDHDVWLLNEEYHYYDYIASDMPLSQIKWEGMQNLFDPGIDAAVNDLLARISEKNGGCRPDIALFHEEGSAVIVEFKAPGVSLDEHDNDLMEYATLLAAKSQGRLRKFYGYLIGDTINPVRLRGYNKLPGSDGFFSTDDVKEPTSQATLGQLYSELLFYSDVVSRARKRIGVYRDRLRLPRI